LSTPALEPLALIYQGSGNPAEVLSLVPVELPALGEADVAVEMIAAPINPADINMVEGSYPIAPPVPAVGGNEGVGRVTAVGAGVRNLAVGDLVIPRLPAWGTWRTHAVSPADKLMRVPPGLPAVAAATLAVNPCTALRMLEDFVGLSSGDVVVQNGANSAVGQAVIQIARSRGIRTVNIVRCRPGHEEVIQRLEELGGDVVTTDAGVRRAVAAAGLPRARLALNMVGGASAASAAKMLEDGGTLVTYGGMSRQPAHIPTGLLIFKDIRARGFWLSRWVEENSVEERYRMFEQLQPLVASGQLTLRTRGFHINNFRAAVAHATSTGGTDEKAILLLQERE